MEIGESLESARGAKKTVGRKKVTFDPFSYFLNENT